MNVSDYIHIVNQRFQAGNATEHSYRGDLQNLLESLLPNVDITNEPKRIDCGAPDYIISRKGKDIPVGYIEAKDVIEDINAKKHQEQFSRYRAALDNLIITDYLQFQFYKDGNLIESVSIAHISNGSIQALPQHFERFQALVQNFASVVSQSIKSPTKLAGMMAGKARLMAQVIYDALEQDDKAQSNSELQSQREAFKSILIHDIDNAQFADIYAQTIAYGLFAARYHDPTLPTFSREEAATLIPKSNPFLRKLFQTVATYSLDDNVGQRLLWIVEELVQVFLATDVAKIMQSFGKSTRQQDPIVHFYETFLAEYDPKLRKARGVWYTPEPVVNFIVRAVDDILKNKFNLPQGLADTSKITREIESIEPGSKGKPVKKQKTFHRVQILDPATGTGTFLAKTVEHIYQNHFSNMQGMWPAYVKEHLIPRLNGFELLMTSYAMAHLKLDMLLTQTGYQAENNNERFHIYLTNSLEEHHPDTGTLFASWLSSEANEANHIKRDAPVMVVIGNPPYSVSSSNKSDWIQDLLKDYKKDLNERKINLDDDYIKFIRFGQHFIDKNGEGVLAYISNNSFIDGITHRQMRKHLLESFDEIYVLDLNGNAQKQLVSESGAKDENVFDIMVGVNISLFIKHNKKHSLSAKVFHSSIVGRRVEKYQALINDSISNILWDELEPTAPNYFFIPKNYDEFDNYSKGLKIDDLFLINSNGIETQKDELNIFFSEKDAVALVDTFRGTPENDLIAKYNMIDGTEWKSLSAINDLKKSVSSTQPIQYRPFDFRFTTYTGKTNGIMARPRHGVMKNFIKRENLGLSSMRQFSSENFSFILISNCIIDNRTFYSNRGKVNFFPLYTYPDSADFLSETARTPNLNMQIVSTIAQGLGLTFTGEKTDEAHTFAPIDLLDYIYSVLHSPSYRETYKEFLKIDFPRVPYPNNTETFWQLVKLGSELRKTHLLETSATSNVRYPVAGNHVVGKLRYEDNKVYINDTQYFDHVPQLAWKFYIGGYQPAQKWLKDRKGKALTIEDIQHYQKIIHALCETDRLMQLVDAVLEI